ncbi:MAG: GIY-YIG nuclease family protein [Gemmatimonadetes bacterium]|jgi:hypothetical protein|nr:GIY-YIG nuclease family protein [Gemmatimonadota bacterium]HQW66243.1 GIY-YIG nuclease family protein [Gemmatimonadales bacterium]
MPRPAYIYILANWKRVTYVGVTTNLPRRLEWHLSAAPPLPREAKDQPAVLPPVREG